MFTNYKKDIESTQNLKNKLKAYNFNNIDYFAINTDTNLKIYDIIKVMDKNKIEKVNKPITNNSKIDNRLYKYPMNNHYLLLLYCGYYYNYIEFIILWDYNFKNI